MAENSSQSSLSSASSDSTSTFLLSTSSSFSSLSSFSSSMSSVSSSSSSEIKGTILSISVEGVSWNRVKFVSSEMAAVPTTAGNRLAQTFGVASATFQVGSISVYLRERQGSGIDYAINAEVRIADADGTPTSTVVASAQVMASSITWTGWHTFSFTMDESTTPLSRKLAVVFWQDGGDEDDYVAWVYTIGSDVGALATYSNDGGATWLTHDGIVRMIRVSRSYDPFASICEDGVLRSSTAETFLASFNNFDSRDEDGGAANTGSHDGTEAIGVDSESSQNENNSESSLDDSFTNSSESSHGQGVMISTKKLLVSIVVDNSGSMGWNDRGKNKVVAVSEIIRQVKEKYPGPVLFDLVAVGSGGIGIPSYGGGSNYATIKLNPNNPTATYANNDGTAASLNDSIVACGFSNLENSHTYALQSVVNGDVVLFDGSGLVDPTFGIRVTDNVQSIGPVSSPVIVSVQDVGTGAEVEGYIGSSATVAEVPSSGATQVRRPVAGGRQYAMSGLTDTVVPGNTRMPIETPSTFATGDAVDLVDAYNFSAGHVVASIGPAYVDITPAPLVTFGSNESTRGGFIQQTSAFGGTLLDTSAQIELLVKDSSVSRQVTFFVQTIKGGRFEWSFLPMSEWLQQFVVYVDRPEDLVTYLTDASGKALPRATRVKYYIDNRPSFTNQNLPFFLAVRPVTLQQGDDRIYMTDVSEVKVGDNVTLVASNGANYPGYMVADINDVDLFIRILPPVLQDSVELVGLIFKTPDQPQKDGGLLDIVFTAVDSSAATAGRQGTNMLPSDLPQLPIPSGDLDDYNQDRSRWLTGSFDVAAIQSASDNTKIVSSLHVTPMTDDHVNQISDEESRMTSVLNQATLTDDELAQLEALENQYEQIAASQPGSIAEVDDNSSSSEGPPVDNVSGDYVLSPSEAQLGANTRFSSFTQSMGLVSLPFQDLSFGYGATARDGSGAGETGLIAKKYTVYPVVFIKNAARKVTARYLLREYPVYFASPIQSFCQPESEKTVTFGMFCCTNQDGEVAYYNVTVPGVFAASGDSIRLDYMIYNRARLVSGSSMRVKIVDGYRTLSQVDNEPWSYVPILENDLGYRPPDCARDCGNLGPPSPGQSFNRRAKNSDGSYKWAIDSDYGVEATYLDGYTEGGFAVPINHGLASFTIPAVDVVTRLTIISEVVCTDNPAFSCVRADYVWVKNPIELKVQIPKGYDDLLGTGSSQKGGLDQPPFEAGVVMTCFGASVPDNTPITLNGSVHKKYKPGDDAKIDPDSPEGQNLQQQQDAVQTLMRQGGFYAGEAAGVYAGLTVQMQTLMLESNYWPATPVKPSIGKTIGGLASGYLVGPHGPVTMHKVKKKTDGETDEVLMGDTEGFVATASYQPPLARGAFNVTASTPVMWVGDEEKVLEMFIYVSKWINGQKAGMLDGTYCDGWNSIVLVADIPGSKNRGFQGSEDQFICDYAVGRVAGRQAANVTFRSEKSGSIPAPIPGRTTQFYDTRPTDPITGLIIGEVDEAEGAAFGWAAVAFTLSADISPATQPCSVEPPCCWPPCDKVYVTGMLIRPFHGCPVEQDDGCSIVLPSGLKGYKYPMISWINPLKVDFALNGAAAPLTPFDFVRDGVTSTEIWVDVTFSGEPLPLVARRHNVMDATGAPMPMPRISLDAYYLDQTWDEVGTLIREEEVRDGTLSFSESSPAVSICRTTSISGHYHSCTVDDITGNGVTTGTFAENSITVMDDHVHTVTNFVVEYSDAVAAHNHQLRSTAVVKLNPIKNKIWNVCVKATVSYDASATPVGRTKSFSVCSSLQWFDFWDMQLQVPNIVGVEADVLTSNHGLDIVATLQHHQNGSLVPVTDEEGVRVTFDVKAYKVANPSDDAEAVPTFDTSAVAAQDFAIVDITATAVAGGKVIARKGSTLYKTANQWTPSVEGLTDEPTDDTIYLEQAMANTGKVMGASQIYDGVVLAADRLNLWMTDNQEWSSADKAIFLLTDGCEGLSWHTLNQIPSRMNLLAQHGRSPFLASMVFGSPSQYDLALMEKIRGSTGGALVRIPIGYDPSLIPDKVSELFSLGIGMFNSGTYTGTIDVGATTTDTQLVGNGSFESIVIDAYIPDGAAADILFRFSDDGIIWTEWTAAYPLSGTTTIPLPSVLARYMQYTVRMTGNENFESPVMKGVTTTYSKPSTDVFFLRPVPIDASADDYVGEVVMTHAEEAPAGSHVTYGLAHHDTPDKADYSWVTRPWFVDNQREMVLTRFNEPTVTDNYRAFTAINGPWPAVAAVGVYLMGIDSTEGVLLSQDDYALNNKTGTVSLVTPAKEGDRIIVDIKPDNVLRLAIKVFNPSRTPVEIGQVTVMYNKTKRVRRTSDGTIVRHPMGDEIDDSSSSSSSLSSSSSVK